MTDNELYEQANIFQQYVAIISKMCSQHWQHYDASVYIYLFLAASKLGGACNLACTCQQQIVYVVMIYILRELRFQCGFILGLKAYVMSDAMNFLKSIFVYTKTIFHIVLKNH